MKPLHPNDVRNRTKEEAARILYQAEMTYLMSRGWTVLAGTRDNKFLVAPGEDYHKEGTKVLTMSEALKIQKETDGWQE